MKEKSIFGLLLILSPFVFSFAFGLDIYVPIIPKMMSIFHTTQNLVQLTLSLFIGFIGLGELFLGPLSDQIGRFKTSILSASLFAIGGALSAISINITMLIIARIICALGASGLIVVAFAIVRDLFEGNKSAQMFSYLNAAIGISPTFAPIIGSYLAVSYGWSSVFWFLAGLGLVTLAIGLFLIKETHPTHKRIKLDKQIFNRYWTLFKSKEFSKYILYSGLGVSICFSFFSVSSLVVINLLHMSIIKFGYVFAIFGLVIGLGGVLSGYVVGKLGINKTIKIGIIMISLGGILMAAAEILWGLSLWGFMLPTVIACTGAVFLVGAGAAGAMTPFPHIAGTAAACLGCSQFVVASIIGSVLMVFPVTSSLSYAITIIIVSILAKINSIVFR